MTDNKKAKSICLYTPLAHSNINYLKEAALSQIKSDKDIKKYLNKGLNYPSAINELTDKIINKPNNRGGKKRY